MLIRINQFNKNTFTNLLHALGKLVKEIKINNNDVELKTVPTNFRSLAFVLRNHTLFQYKQLIDIACSDVPSKSYRFAITYLFFSPIYASRLALTIQTNEVLTIPTICELYDSAGWLEREVYDLFGIMFSGHPDLRRILTDYGFSGHPLRKDFPLTGFVEVYYNDSTKRMLYSNVELAQEYRTFTLKNDWINK